MNVSEWRQVVRQEAQILKVNGDLIWGSLSLSVLLPHLREVDEELLTPKYFHAVSYFHVASS
jgi:hypothetical protein